MMRLFRRLPLGFRLRLLARYVHGAFSDHEQDVIIEVLTDIQP